MKQFMTGIVAALAMGAFGIVMNDPLPVTETQTTPVPVPYAWLDAHVPGIAYACEAYEAAATATAANGRKEWECYALGLDPQVATNDFRIASFPMKADGTPDLANVTFNPPREQWNVSDAPVVWKGATQLEGPWRTVKVGGRLVGSGSSRHAVLQGGCLWRRGRHHGPALGGRPVLGQIHPLQRAVCSSGTRFCPIAHGQPQQAGRPVAGELARKESRFCHIIG